MCMLSSLHRSLDKQISLCQPQLFVSLLLALSIEFGKIFFAIERTSNVKILKEWIGLLLSKKSLCHSSTSVDMHTLNSSQLFLLSIISNNNANIG